MNNRELGKKYEDIAMQYLEKTGFKILERNYRIRTGEIDIIALKPVCYNKKINELHLIEVKFRRNLSCGLPEEAVGIKKQKQICKVYDYYRLTHPQYNDCQVCFDIVAINGVNINFYENVFYYSSNALF